MSSFSFKHKGHFFVPVGICLMILYLMLNALLVSLRCHTCLESSVSFWYLLLLSDFWWFLDRALKSLAVTPM